MPFIIKSLASFIVRDEFSLLVVFAFRVDFRNNVVLFKECADEQWYRFEISMSVC